LFNGQLQVGPVYGLPGGTDGGAALNRNFAFLGFEAAFNQGKEGAFPGAVLPHEGDFGAFTDTKRGFIQNGLLVDEFENDIVETEDYFFGHGIIKRLGLLWVGVKPSRLRFIKLQG
jgi:hypothetical protein